MSKIEELDKLDKAIKDAEIHLKSIQINIEKIGNEINALTPRKNELEQNMEFHKKEDTIPIAQEYKKTKTELSKVKTRLTAITSDQKKCIQACKDIEKIIDRFRKDYYELIKDSENNILRPTFGGNNGKE